MNLREQIQQILQFAEDVYGDDIDKIIEAFCNFLLTKTVTAPSLTCMDYIIDIVREIRGESDGVSVHK